MPRYRVRTRSFINGAQIERGNVVTLPAESVTAGDLWPKGHLELLADEPVADPQGPADPDAAPAPAEPAPEPAPAEEPPAPEAADEGEEH